MNLVVIALVPTLLSMAISALIFRRLDRRDAIGLPVRLGVDTTLYCIAMFLPFFAFVFSFVMIPEFY